MKLSAVILTKDEEANIRQEVHSLKFCDEVIVVDDHSDDKTVEIAKDLDCRVYKRKLDNDFAEQRNFGLGKAKGDWVLFIDADERVCDGFGDEVKDRLNDMNYDGYYIKRHEVFHGKLLKHGSWSGWHLRLARKTGGKWTRKVHEVWKIKGKVGYMSSSILHQSHENVAQFLASINTYSSLHAEENYKEGKKSTVLKIIVFPVFKFMHNYFLLRGYKDGVPGFLYASMMSLHSFKSWAHHYLIYERKRT